MLNKNSLLIFSTLVTIFCIFCIQPKSVFAGSDDTISGWGWGEAYVDFAPGGIINQNDGQQLQQNGNQVMFNFVKSFLAQTFSSVAFASDDFPNIDDANDLAGGMGWLSFNCTTDPNDPGCTNSYGVNLDATTGAMTGYAWSDNFGWVEFGIGCPSWYAGAKVGGTTYLNNQICDVGSKLIGTDVLGWAKVLSASDAGANSGGWDGWISLSKYNDQSSAAGIQLTTYDYGVSYDETAKKLVGYAWGDINTGWLDFYDVPANVNIDTNTGPVAVNFLGNAETLPGGSADLQWTLTTDAYPTTCSIVSTPTSLFTPSSYSFTVQPATQTLSVGPLNPATTPFDYTYKITCTNTLGSGDDSATVTVTNNPSPDLSFYPDSFTAFYDQSLAEFTANLNWSTQNTTYTSCVGTGGGSDWAQNKAVPLPGGNAEQQVGVIVPDPSTTFTLSCTTSSGEVINRDVTIVQADASASISGSCVVAGSGVAPQVNWNSSNTSSCSVTDGSANGFSTGGNTSGSDQVLGANTSGSPLTAGDYTFDISCPALNGGSPGVPPSPATVTVKAVGEKCATSGGGIIPGYIER